MKSIPHPDPIVRQHARLEQAIKFFYWLDEMTMGMWSVELPDKKLRRKFVMIRVESPYPMLEKLQLWTRLNESGLRVAPTYTKTPSYTVFRLRFDCFACALQFAQMLRGRWERDVFHNAE